MITGNKILLINCSFPNYNLAIEKMKIFYGSSAVVVRSVADMFNQDYDGVCLSAIFSWDVPFLISQAKQALHFGKQVMIGGGGTFKLSSYIFKETGIRPQYKPNDQLDSIESKFKMVYFTRGCIETCSFCNVWRIEGRNVTINRKSNPAPVLMDNNLSEIPQEFQEFIVERYLSSDIKTLDCNSGFEPKGINERVVKLFDKLPLRWWRMGFDVITEEKEFIEAVNIIKEFSNKPIRAYTMFGHEPYDICKYRCEKVIELGCEPVPQAMIELDSKTKTPAILFDWTDQKIKDFQRFYYKPQLWRKLKTIDNYTPRKKIHAYIENQGEIDFGGCGNDNCSV